MDLHVRRAELGDAPAIAHVEIASWRSTYREIVPQEHLRRMSFVDYFSRWTRALSRGDNTTYVGVGDDDEVRGFAMAGRDRSGNSVYRGELYVIYLLPEVQRRGLGRRLIAAVAEDLAGEGIDSMRVWALDRNPFCKFYAALGGVPAGRRAIEIGGRTLVIVAYGWPDTSELRAQAARRSI